MRHTSNRRRSESVRGVAYQRAAKASTEVFDRVDEENGVECPVCHVKIKIGPGGKLVKHAPGGSKVQEKFGRPACWGGGPDSEPVVDPNPQPPRLAVTSVPRPSWQRERFMGRMWTGHGTVHLYEVVIQRRVYIPTTASRMGHWGFTPKSEIPESDYAHVACDGNAAGVSAAWCFTCKRDDLPGCEHVVAVLKHIREEIKRGIEWVPYSDHEIQVQIVRAAKPAPSNTEPDRLFLWSNLKKLLKVEDRILVNWPVDETRPWINKTVQVEVVVTGLGSAGRGVEITEDHRGAMARRHRVVKKIEEAD